MERDFVCQEEFGHKIWGIGIGDHYQKKRGMFFETSYFLLSGRSDLQSIYFMAVTDDVALY
jgi:hypothetical protein